MHYLFHSFIVLSKGTVSRGDKHGQAMQRGLGGSPHERLHQDTVSDSFNSC
ncbi:hypothetical protein [Moorena sp. SIO3H5]|uniref:hypothetical protein n=1 Tax=Moorena sp. SIO3H5 TaxID=2607834 RepID=UPI0013B9130D|nr:hypothetical protein [Moorena sp. SIO3H5]NEO73955.1 hypothetical protein [Moorena sp. SIO3H5]